MCRAPPTAPPAGYRKCPQCDKSEIQSTKDCAGVRMNGYDYGTEVFKCKACGWETSFQYDEAAEVYYYETSGWKRRDPTRGACRPPPPHPPRGTHRRCGGRRQPATRRTALRPTPPMLRPQPHEQGTAARPSQSPQSHVPQHGPAHIVTRLRCERVPDRSGSASS